MVQDKVNGLKPKTGAQKEAMELILKGSDLKIMSPCLR